MLHARIEVAQILDLFQVRAVITEFSPGTDPVVWSSGNLTLDLPEDVTNEDALTIVLAAIRLWSEMTNSE
jgi:hypothetical protein